MVLTDEKYKECVRVLNVFIKTRLSNFCVENGRIVTLNTIINDNPDSVIFVVEFIQDIYTKPKSVSYTFKSVSYTFNDAKQVLTNYVLNQGLSQASLGNWAYETAERIARDMYNVVQTELNCI